MTDKHAVPAPSQQPRRDDAEKIRQAQHDRQDPLGGQEIVGPDVDPEEPAAERPGSIHADKLGGAVQEQRQGHGSQRQSQGIPSQRG